jgi:hypothetical protein
VQNRRSIPGLNPVSPCAQKNYKVLQYVGVDELHINYRFQSSVDLLCNRVDECRYRLKTSSNDCSFEVRFELLVKEYLCT